MTAEAPRVETHLCRLVSLCACMSRHMAPISAPATLASGSIQSGLPAWAAHLSSVRPGMLGRKRKWSLPLGCSALQLSHLQGAQLCQACIPPLTHGSAAFQIPNSLQPKSGPLRAMAPIPAPTSLSGKARKNSSAPLSVKERQGHRGAGSIHGVCPGCRKLAHADQASTRFPRSRAHRAGAACSPLTGRGCWTGPGTSAASHRPARPCPRPAGPWR